MGSPEWSRDPRFTNRTVMNNEYADEIDGYMEEWLLQHTKAELLEMAMEHRIPPRPCPRLRRGAQRPRPVRLVRGNRPSRRPPPLLPNAPYTLTDAPSTATSPAPFLGQHNEEVYTGELGFTHEQLVALYQTG